MSTFKITNITNLAGKRDHKYNSALDIEYIDNMTKKKITIKPGETKYLTIGKLPISAHRMRVKNLITVSEVSAVEMTHIMNNDASKSKQSEVLNQKNKDESLKKSPPKKTGRNFSNSNDKVGKKEGEE